MEEIKMKKILVIILGLLGITSSFARKPETLEQAQNLAYYKGFIGREVQYEPSDSVTTNLMVAAKPIEINVDGNMTFQVEWYQTSRYRKKLSKDSIRVKVWVTNAFSPRYRKRESPKELIKFEFYNDDAYQQYKNRTLQNMPAIGVLQGEVLWPSLPMPKIPNQLYEIVNVSKGYEINNTIHFQKEVFHPLKLSEANIVAPYIVGDTLYYNRYRSYFNDEDIVLSLRDLDGKIYYSATNEDLIKELILSPKKYIPKQYTVKISTPGTILNHVDFNDLESITELTVSGTLNSTDILAIRRMTNLQVLNLKDAKMYYDANGLKGAKESMQYKIFGDPHLYLWNTTAQKEKEMEVYEQTMTKIYEQCLVLPARSFAEFESLQRIILPENILIIGRSSFKDCINLKEVTMSNSVQIIENYAFNGCTSLSKITLSSELQSIGDYTFAKCQTLTNIMIPSKLKRLGERVFWSCNTLESITLPSGVLTIPSGCFYSCEKLKSITFSGVKHIYTDAFVCCSALEFMRCTTPEPPVFEEGEIRIMGHDCKETGNDLKQITFYFPKSSATLYIASPLMDVFSLKSE